MKVEEFRKRIGKAETGEDVRKLIYDISMACVDGIITAYENDMLIDELREQVNKMGLRRGRRSNERKSKKDDREHHWNQINAEKRDRRNRHCVFEHWRHCEDLHA